jgi:magnesium-transporting ATPase (P-type)
MKAYVIVAGVIFGVLALVHLWRMTVEPHLAKDPSFWLVTMVAGALSVAAWWVVRRSRVA